MHSADCNSRSGEGSGVVQPCETHKGANTGGFLFIYMYIFFGEVHKFRLSGGGGYMYLLHKVNGKVHIWRSGLVSQC